MKGQRTVLFQPLNHIGLGHINRLPVIARALTELHNTVRTLLTRRSDYSMVRSELLRRGQVAEFFRHQAPCLIGIEATQGAQYWARVLRALGHEVRLLAPQFVKPYLKSSKNYANDAEAICEAVSCPNSPRLEYARRLFDNCTDWYKSADNKAQVLLGLDGAFLAFLTGSAFSKPEDSAKIVARFGPDTWILLGVMCAALTASILSAILCLWSRTYSGHDEIERRFSDLKVAVRPLPPQIMWFQYIPKLDSNAFTEQLLEVHDDEFETRVMASQIIALSQNVVRKHNWINRGFSSAAASLILFIAAVISYVAHIK